MMLLEEKEEEQAQKAAAEWCLKRDERMVKGL
jgi:hypothetical protein